MSDGIEAKLAELKAKFIEQAADRLAQVLENLDRLDADDGNEEAARDLVVTVHKLSGGGGTFGFPLVSRIAGDMELLLDGNNRDWARFRRLANGLQAVVEAGGELPPERETALLDELADALAPAP
ncbi:MAG: Hpt domain-containing protein [Rhodospirillales bacterium]